MLRRDLLESGVRSATALLAAPMLNRGRCAAFGGQRTYSTRTLDLVERCLVVDMLGLLTLDWAQLGAWHSRPESFSCIDAEPLRTSGIDIFHPAVRLNGMDPYDSALDWFTRWNRLLSARPDVFARVDCAGDCASVRAGGRIGVLLGLQNADHFRSPADVRFFHSLGQRISQLTYNSGNSLGSGCADRDDRGLTPFGAEIVAAMNAAGMAVDLSHAGERTSLDAIAASSRPVLITHANCRALVPHPRCKSDAVIRAMAATGSVMGLTGIGMFVSRRESASIEDLLDHYNHVARLVGVEHLGIGSDSDPLGRDRRLPRARGRRPLEIAGFNHPRRVYDLVEGLIRRRYTDRHIELILGANVTRVLAAVQSPIS